MGRRDRAPLTRSLPRFFVPPGAITESEVRIEGEDAHKIKRVLRLEAGDEIAVLDNSGFRFHARLTTVENAVATALILSKEPLNTEPQVKITIAQSLAKGDKIEQVIQKGVEAGASGFLLMQTERCIVQLEGSKSENRLSRYQKIALEAAEQSNRALVPPVEGIVSLEDALSKDGLKLFLYEGENLPSLKSVLSPDPPAHLLLYIGPEGGFSEREVELARAKNAQIVSLGSRILRTETAGLVALSQLLFAYEP